MVSKMTSRDIVVAMGCAMFVTIMFCVRLGVVAGDYRPVVMYMLFAIPFSLAITTILLLPAIAVLRRLRATSVTSHVLPPALIVLAAYMAPVLLNAHSYGVLRFLGRPLISDGKVVWENFPWMIAYHAEPAMWAALAGFLFWYLTVKRRRA